MSFYIHIYSRYVLLLWVSSDLEKLEMSANFDARRKSQGIYKVQEKSVKSQGILL